MRALLIFGDGNTMLADVNPQGAKGELFWHRRRMMPPDARAARKAEALGGSALGVVKVDRVTLVNRGHIRDGVYLFEEDL